MQPLLSWDAYSHWSEKELLQGYQSITISTAIHSPLGTTSPTVIQRIRQRVWRNDDLILGETSALTFEMGENENSIVAAAERLTPTRQSDDNRKDLVVALEAALTEGNLSKHHYSDIVVCRADDPGHRRAVGLPPSPLITNDRLLSTSHHLEGVHYSNVALTGCQSFGFLHKGVANLQTALVLWSGQPIVWVVIPPRHSDKLEARVNDYLKIQPSCSQFISHENMIIPPSTLDKWGVNFCIFRQYPGEAVRTDYLAYSYTWHTGPSKWEAVHCSESDWSLPPMYVFCPKGEKCGIGPHLTAAALTMSAYRPLQVSGEPEGRRLNLVPPRDMPTTDHGKLSDDEWLSENLSSTLVGSGGDQATAGGDDGCFTSPKSSSPRAEVDSRLFAVASGTVAPSEPNNPFTADIHEVAQQRSENMFIASPPEQGDLSWDSPRMLSDHSPGSEYFISTNHLSSRRPVGYTWNLPTQSPSPSVPQSDDSDEAMSPMGALGAPPSDDSDEAQSQPSPAGIPSSLGVVAPTTVEDPSSLFFPESRQDAVVDLTFSPEGEMVSDTEPDDAGFSPSTAPHPVTGLENHNDQSINPLYSLADRSGALELNLTDHEAAREIDELIALGMKHWPQFDWLTTRTFTSKDDSKTAAERMFTTMRPMNWLNDDAIMETLYHLVNGRDDVYVLDSLTFESAYQHKMPGRMSRWTSQTLVLIPVFQNSHWYLVSLKFSQRIFTIHDRDKHSSIEKFILEALSDPWSVEYRNVSVYFLSSADADNTGQELSNDGMNCGIILLQEAELLLNPDLMTSHSFYQLRWRYLRLLLGKIISQLYPRTLIHNGDRDLNTGSPSSLSIGGSALEQSNVDRLSLSPNELEHLASTIGCSEVLRNLRMMVKLLRESLPQGEPSLEVALATFKRGRSNKSLGLLQQDHSSLPVARRFRQLETEIREAMATKRGKRKRGQPGPGDPGKKADHKAYNRMIQEWKVAVDSDSALRDELKIANNWGKHLLQYEDVCGPTHPLWMLLPAENTRCPMNPSFIVKRSM